MTIAQESARIPEPKAKRITVSAFSIYPDHAPRVKGQEAVDFIKEFWKYEIATELPSRPDLIVLPEACDRIPMSDADKAEFYRVRGNQILDFFREMARENRCYITYPWVRVMPDGTRRNSITLIDRKGEIAGTYNKNYPVPSETTESGILCGKDATVIETDFGRVALAICFDLNFPELLARYKEQKPDLIVFCSMYHGGLMQKYWAYECRSHFVGAIARTESTVVNPVGETVARSTNYIPKVTATINLDSRVVHLDDNWVKMQAAREKYGRGVTIYDPGHLGTLLFCSEMADKSVDELIREFDIELWDDYYRRSVQHRENPTNVEP